jgi:hypothetical protein
LRMRVRAGVQRARPGAIQLILSVMVVTGQW